MSRSLVTDESRRSKEGLVEGDLAFWKGPSSFLVVNGLRHEWKQKGSGLSRTGELWEVCCLVGKVVDPGSAEKETSSELPIEVVK